MTENKLWYKAPANDWNEALPLGNGKLGMMVFGGVSEERVQLNEETFWSGWECHEYDNPETAEHLDEMRRLVFAGEYAKAQEMCCKYMVCRGVNKIEDSLIYRIEGQFKICYVKADNEISRSFRPLAELIYDKVAVKEEEINSAVIV